MARNLSSSKELEGVEVDVTAKVEHVAVFIVDWFIKTTGWFIETVRSLCFKEILCLSIPQKPLGASDEREAVVLVDEGGTRIAVVFLGLVLLFTVLIEGVHSHSLKTHDLGALIGDVVVHTSGGRVCSGNSGCPRC